MIGSIQIKIKHIVSYSTIALILRLIPYSSMYILINTLTPTDFGIWATLNAIITVSALIAGLGIKQRFAITYFHAPQNNHSQLMSITLATQASSILFFLLMSAFLYKYLISFSTPYMIGIAIFCSICTTLNELFYQLLRTSQNIKLLVYINCFSTLLLSSLMLYSVLFLKLGIEGLLLSMFISLCSVSLISFFYYIKYNYYQSECITYKEITQCLRESLLFFPNGLTHWIILTNPRWFLGFFCSFHEVGLYTFSDVITQLYDVAIIQPLLGLYAPAYLASLQALPDNHKEIERNNKYIMVLSMCGLSMVTLGAYSILLPYISFYIPHSYHEAFKYIPFILIGNVLLMGSHFSTLYLQYHKKNSFITYSSFISAISNIMLNWRTVPILGSYGCVIALLSSHSLYFLLTISYNLWLIYSIPEMKESSCH